MISELLIPLVLVSGVGIGLVSAMAGVGGGVLVIPFLILGLGIDVRVAVATSLLCVVITSSSAASVYLREGLIDVKALSNLEPTTALGAVVGAYITLTLPPHMIKFALGILLLYVSLTMIKSVIKGVGRGVEGTYGGTTPLRRLVGATLSFLAGLASGTFGIGGGVVKVPIMNLVLRVPMKVAVATSSLMVGLTASAGELPYLIHGLPNPLLALALALGIVPGATLGAKLMGRLRTRYVKLIFSAILLYVSTQLVITSLMRWVS